MGPLPADLSPLACLLAWNGWFFRALYLCSLVKAKQWPRLRASSTWKSVLFTVWIRQSWIGVGHRQNFRLKLHPKPLFLKQSCLSKWFLWEMLTVTCPAAHTASFLSSWTHPPQQFPDLYHTCCLHPTNLLLSHPAEKFNSCQNHEHTETVSRPYSTTTWCLQLQPSTMEKEEKAGTSSRFLQL